MLAGLPGAVAIALVAVLCYCAPKSSLSGFARMRLPLLGIAAAAWAGACLFPDKAFFVAVSSFCASFALITFVTLLMVHVWGSKGDREQNQIAAFAYPSLVLLTAWVAYLTAGWYAAAGAVLAGVTLVVCVYGRSALLRRARQKSRVPR
jgi:hypothetical protein